MKISLSWGLGYFDNSPRFLKSVFRGTKCFNTMESKHCSSKFLWIWFSRGRTTSRNIFATYEPIGTYTLGFLENSVQNPDKDSRWASWTLERNDGNVVGGTSEWTTVDTVSDYSSHVLTTVSHGGGVDDVDNINLYSVERTLSDSSTALQSPHLHFANGARADFRGIDKTLFNFVSSHHMNINIMTMKMQILN